MRQFICVFAFCLVVALSAAEGISENSIVEPTEEYLPPVGEAEAAELAQDGYRYKTIRKLRLRHRREVPSVDYLPPVAPSPNVEYLPPVAEQSPDTKVADDGYRYKTVRKLKFRTRHRRDVSEIAEPIKEYLPPVDVALAPELKDILGPDGYRYKTVRRLKYRRHRREANPEAEGETIEAAPSAEYLPPAVETAPAAEAVEVVAEPKSAELAQDGYRYKTIRRIRYRHRH